ncbi:Major facilitator superfamily domain general substrate transporter [Penicillium cf. viridicatum]|uniref:Major facilitator superfamily domain general substrate transporter n=1 Tax=Penicillium cf. viridicatum TaxID=2972119 RepID=A0A9W9M319_9EURO|nr:Major facilitator superfamily domain general substrate transporter [Penicillium cf. viridicatum]
MAETRYSTPDEPPIDSSNLVGKQDGVELSVSSDDTELKCQYPSGLAVTLILTSVTLAYFLFFLDLAVISTATPAITTQFDSLVDVGWYGGAYQLGSAAFQPLSGKIYSRFSIKWTFLVFFVIFEVGSAICGAAHSSAMFIIGRVIAGTGSAGVANGAVTTISAVLPTQKQALFMGLNIGFYINLPLGVIVGGFLLFNTIPEPKPKDPPLQILSSVIKSLDLPGFMLICPAVVMFLLGLQFGGNEYAWDSSVVIGLLVGAGATFVVFLIWEWRQGDNAMVPLAMLKHRVIWSAAMTMFFSLSSVLVADFYIAIYFQAIHDDTPLMSGVHMLPITLGIVLFTMISGTLISVSGYYLPFLLMGGVISSIGYGLMSTLDTTTPVAKWIGCCHPSLIAANAIFSNSLRSELQKRATQISVSPDAIINAGVRSIRDMMSGSELTAVLEAYAKSIDKVMYLGIAVSIAVLAFSPGLGWKDIRKAKLQVIIDKSPDGGDKDSAVVGEK